MEGCFPICAKESPWQTPGVLRTLALIALLPIALAAPLRGAEDSMARYNVVAVKPSSTSIYVGTVSMTIPPFVRKNVVFASTYSAKVFPYFFYNETGRIWIIIPEQDLHRIDLGKTIDFTGSALSDSGEKRKVEGWATPTGPMTGRLRVRVYVTRRIALTYETTYELKGLQRPTADITPR